MWDCDETRLGISRGNDAAKYRTGPRLIISRRRTAAARIARWLWGKERYFDDYVLVSWVFLRFIALIYLTAFASMAVQITGLAGAGGISGSLHHSSIDKPSPALSCLACFDLPRRKAGGTYSG